MPRGIRSKNGDTRISRNGYHYTRTKEGWNLTHRIVAEQKLGRALNENERVRFKDGDRSNVDASNLEVFVIREASRSKRRAALEAKIEELQAELEMLDREIE